ncbi:MAG: vanadium-dependent haloperoxidase [Chitinophagaceae bacterium]
MQSTSTCNFRMGWGKMLTIAGLVFLLSTISSCEKIDLFGHKGGGGNEDPGRVATDWYRLQMRILLERNSAFNANAFMGYIGIGLYESVRYGTKHSVSFSTRLYQMPAMPIKENNNGYNWQLSANAAMAAMLRSFYQGLTPANLASIDSLENAYNEILKPAAASEVFARSQAFGKSIAAAVYNWYLTDNINVSNAGYVPPVFPGSWVPTLPALANGINPNIGTARTYLAEHLSGVSPAFLSPYSETVNSDFYNIQKNVYDVSKTLTPEQKDIALFWVDQGNGVGYTPPGHDFLLVTQALEQTGASLATAAETFAKSGIAERDGAVVCFRSKYTYNLLRPITYIRKVIDPTWLPFIVTPPHPEYPAAHAFVTGAVMQAATKVLGEHVKVTDHSYDFRGYPTRTYNSIFAAAEEAGISRLYGGIHTLPSINTGLAMAKEIGNRVGNIKLTDE